MRRQYHPHSNTARTERQFSNLRSKASPGSESSSEARAFRRRGACSSDILTHARHVPRKCEIGAPNNPVRIYGRELRTQANICGSRGMGWVETRHTLPGGIAAAQRVQP